MLIMEVVNTTVITLLVLITAPAKLDINNYLISMDVEVTCNSYNISMRDFPDIHVYTISPQACALGLWAYISGKSLMPMLQIIYVTGFAKTLQLRTKIEIHFIAHYISHAQGLSRNSDTIAIDKEVCFYRRLFADPVKPC